MSYCGYIESMTGAQKTLHKAYHDHHYGYPIQDDNELFGRLILEINQAGLSWEIILKKEAHFRNAYSDFVIEKIAAYTERDRERLLQDAGIVRNRLKINAVIENARTVMQLQQEYGSFEQWLNFHHPKTNTEWMKLFRKTFRFTGCEIVHEFLMSTGYLPGAHTIHCSVYNKVLRAKPRWHTHP